MTIKQRFRFRQYTISADHTATAVLEAVPSLAKWVKSGILDESMT